MWRRLGTIRHWKDQSNQTFKNWFTILEKLLIIQTQWRELPAFHSVYLPMVYLDLHSYWCQLEHPLWKERKLQILKTSYNHWYSLEANSGQNYRLSTLRIHFLKHFCNDYWKMTILTSFQAKSMRNPYGAQWILNWIYSVENYSRLRRIRNVRIHFLIQTQWTFWI